MPILIAIVTLVGVVSLTDLLLTFGVVRRLREHTALLAPLRAGHRPVIGVGVGEAPAPFAAVATDGQPLAGPAGFRAVAFFSSSCSACPERVPPFADYVRANRLGREDVLAVVIGADEEPVPYLEDLAAVALVCREPADGELSKAFAVSGYPAFCLLDADGAVAAADFDPATLPLPVTA
jgi:hypothetical protein